MTYNTPDLLEKTPLTKLLVESREEFKNSDVWFDISVADGTMRIDPRKHSLFIDSLIRKAYLLGLERAKECVPNKAWRVIEDTDTWHVEIEAVEWNTCRAKTLEALDSAIGEANV